MFRLTTPLSQETMVAVLYRIEKFESVPALQSTHKHKSGRGGETFTGYFVVSVDLAT